MRAPSEQSEIDLYLRASTEAEAERVGADQYNGLCFGAEFCGRRLPSPSEVSRVSSLCKELGKNFSLVSPVLREGAFDHARSWLERVAAVAQGSECSINDWGLLLWMQKEQLPLRLVAGRLLGRQRRGPRTVQLILSATPEEAACLKGSVWDDPEVSSLLTDMGLQRIEIDVLLQGARRPVLPPGVSISLCGPWLPATLAPACPWTENPLLCPAKCLEQPEAKLLNDNDPHPLWSRGGAVFVNYGPMPGATLAASLGADRIVWSEEIPG